MALYPLFTDLRGRAVLVVGGGPVAERKALVLLNAGARLTVAAPTLTPRLAELAKRGRLAHAPGPLDPSRLNDQWLVVAASGDRALNRAIAEAAETRRLFVNVVDDAELSTFHVPAIVDRAPLIVAVSSGGRAPALARDVRARIEAVLEPTIGTLAALAARWRPRLLAHLPDADTRRRFFERVVLGPVASLIRRRRDGEAEAALASALARGESDVASGSVVLVGAGPGDPGLLTLAALRALGEADVILHDRLVSVEVLALARRDAERIEVGKSPGGHGATQAAIHALMLERARRGQRVVRLKGGDPFVFGRGGEEIEHLRAHGIPYEVIPGITAATACAAYAGVPLTHREHAQSVRFVTAHCRESIDALDWRALAAERQTLAFYMGTAELERIRERLLAHGRAATTPFAIVENGTRANQRVVVGTLGELAEIAHAHDVVAPALLILGEVAALAERLAWFGPPPLGVASDRVAEAA